MQDEDLRSWISLLESEGELHRVTTEVDWDGELAAICRRTLDNLGPALLFENIKDHQDTWCTKLFTGSLGSARHMGLAFRMGKDARRRDLIKKFRHAMNNPIEPVVVDSGPVKENIIKGRDINLNQIPVPKWHFLDGGRYINTWCGIVTQDPDTGEFNVGMYRGMITAEDKIGVLLLLSQNWGLHFTKYCERQQPMPVAVVYGYDPAFGIAAASMVPTGQSEYGVAGAIRNQPIPLVKCETSDLLVPAAAEIVVEGFIDPDPERMVIEGPFGEYTGYYGGRQRPRYAMQVECITYRNDPIYRASLAGAGPGNPIEDSHLYAVTTKAITLEVLERSGVPGVIDVRLGPLNIVKIKQAYSGHAKQVALALWGSWAAEWMWKLLVVVDEDIDIYNDRAVHWAMAYRMDPGTDDIVVVPSIRGGGLDLKSHDDIHFGTGKRSKILFDATRDIGAAKRDRWGNLQWHPLSIDLHPDDVDKIEKRWSEYGIKFPERKRR